MVYKTVIDMESENNNKAGIQRNIVRYAYVFYKYPNSTGEG